MSCQWNSPFWLRELNLLILQLHLPFLPKTGTEAALSGEIWLQSFHPHPSTWLERVFPANVACSGSLRFYLQQAWDVRGHYKQKLHAWMIPKSTLSHCMLMEVTQHAMLFSVRKPIWSMWTFTQWGMCLHHRQSLLKFPQRDLSDHYLVGNLFCCQILSSGFCCQEHLFCHWSLQAAKRGQPT